MTTTGTPTLQQAGGDYSWGTGATLYVPVCCGAITANATESYFQIPYWKAGTFSRMSLNIISNRSAFTMTFRVDTGSGGADGTQTITTGASPSGQYVDTTHSDIIASSNKVAFKGIGGGTGNSQHVYGMYCLFQATGTTQHVSAAVGPTSFATASVTRYMPIGGDSVVQTNEPAVQSIIVPSQAATSYFSWLTVNVTANARTTQTDFKLRTNGGDAASICSYGSTAVGLVTDTTHEEETSNLYVNFAITTLTTSLTITWQYIAIQVHSSITEWNTFAAKSAGVAFSTANATRVFTLAGTITLLTTANEAQAQSEYSQPIPGDVGSQDLLVTVVACTRSTNTDFHVRVDGVDDAPIVSVNSGSGGGAFPGIFMDTSSICNPASDTSLISLGLTTGTGTGSITISVVSVGWTNTGTDSSVTDVTDTDTATLSEVASIAAAESDVDGGTVTDTAQSPLVPRADSDSATLTDTASVVALTTKTDADSATLTETKQSVAAAERDADSATVTETARHSVDIPPRAATGMDSATLTDVHALLATERDTEPGTLTEAQRTVVADSSLDTSTVSETGAVVATAPSADSGTLTDAAALAAAERDADSGTLTDAESLAATTGATKSDTDSATLTESAVVVATFTTADTAVESAAQAVIVADTDTDTATLTDAESLVATASTAKADTDTATLVDAHLLTVVDADTDTATLIEAQTTVVADQDADSGTVTDDQSLQTTTGVAKSDVDAATFTDNERAAAQARDADSAATTDGQVLAAAERDSDTSTLTDTSTKAQVPVAKADSQSGALTETERTVAQVIDADSAVLADSESLVSGAFATKTDTDSATLSEAPTVTAAEVDVQTGTVGEKWATGTTTRDADGSTVTDAAGSVVSTRDVDSSIETETVLPYAGAYAAVDSATVSEAWRTTVAVFTADPVVLAEAALVLALLADRDAFTLTDVAVAQLVLRTVIGQLLAADARVHGLLASDRLVPGGFDTTDRPTATVTAGDRP